MKKKKRYTTEKTWETTCQRARSRTGPGRGEEGQTRLKLIVGFHMGIRNVVKVMGSSHVGDDDGDGEGWSAHLFTTAVVRTRRPRRIP
jgi:hypothetical protein